MKYEVGDKILLLQTDEEGIVVDIMNEKMLMIKVGDVTFPVFTDQVDFPYFKMFTQKKTPEKTRLYIDDVRKEKDEQRRIVAEIEKQFTRLEAGVAALRRVQANLKCYRAAVLKAACEGRLVPTEAEFSRAEGRPFESGQQLLARSRPDRRRNHP